ncbi:MAG: hypothetical protein R2865_06550 [Deinococcales bacterium]
MLVVLLNVSLSLAQMTSVGSVAMMSSIAPQLSGRDIGRTNLDIEGLSRVLELSPHIDISFESDASFSALFEYFHLGLAQKGWKQNWNRAGVTGLSALANYSLSVRSIQFELLELGNRHYRLKAFQYH